MIKTHVSHGLCPVVLQLCATYAAFVAPSVSLSLVSRKYDRISPLLRDLHWLRVRERIKFRLVVLVFRCRNQTAPNYLARDGKAMWNANGGFVSVLLTQLFTLFSIAVSVL